MCIWVFSSKEKKSLCACDLFWNWKLIAQGVSHLIYFKKKQNFSVYLLIRKIFAHRNFYLGVLFEKKLDFECPSTLNITSKTSIVNWLSIHINAELYPEWTKYDSYFWNRLISGRTMLLLLLRGKPVKMEFSTNKLKTVLKFLLQGDPANLKQLGKVSSSYMFIKPD